MTKKFDVTGAVLTALLCIAVALAALIFVPSSPALLVDEPVILLEMDTGFVNEWEEPVLLTVTGYSATIAAGAVLAMLATAALGVVKGRSLVQGAATAALCGVGALIGGHGLYCLLRWGYIINDLGGTWSFLLQPWQGGFTMFGAILGGLLGGLAAAKLTQSGIADTMDMIIPGLLILLVAGRLGEMLTGQGMANYRAAEALRMLPFASTNEWGDPELAVYVYEALAGAAALITAAVLLWQRKPAGRAAECALAIVSAYQLMLDSMRGDELIRFGFVCLNMIAAAAVLVFIIATRIIRRVRANGWKPWDTWRIVLLLAGAGIVIAVEFALDGKIKLPGVSNTMLYIIDLLAVTGMMLSVALGDGRKEAA